MLCGNPDHAAPLSVELGDSSHDLQELVAREIGRVNEPTWSEDGISSISSALGRSRITTILSDGTIELVSRTMVVEEQEGRLLPDALFGEILNVVECSVSLWLSGADQGPEEGDTARADVSLVGAKGRQLASSRDIGRGAQPSTYQLDHVHVARGFPIRSDVGRASASEILDAVAQTGGHPSA